MQTVIPRPLPDSLLSAKGKKVFYMDSQNPFACIRNAGSGIREVKIVFHSLDHPFMIPTRNRRVDLLH
jgi:hypothetical protein